MNWVKESEVLLVLITSIKPLPDTKDTAMSNSSRTTLASLISCMLTITAFLPLAMNSPIEAPTSSLEWKLTYKLTTDNET